MKSLFFGLLALTFLAFPNRSHSAVTCTPESLKAAALRELSDLEASGVDKIDGKSISVIKDELKTIEIIFEPQTKHYSQLGVNTRETARWNAQNRTITMSQIHCTLVKPEMRASIFLHEVFGTTGVKDQNFGKSAAIENFKAYRIAVQRTPELIKDRQMGTILQNQIMRKARGGGSTGVDGGGDIRVDAYANLIHAEIFLQYFEGEIDGEVFELLCEYIDHFNIEVSELVEQGDLFVLFDKRVILGPDFPTDSVERMEKNQKRIRKLVLDIRKGQLRAH